MPFKFISMKYNKYFGMDDCDLLGMYPPIGEKYLEPQEINFDLEDNYNIMYSKWLFNIKEHIKHIKAIMKALEIPVGNLIPAPHGDIVDWDKSDIYIVQKGRKDPDQIIMGDIYKYNPLSKYQGLEGKIPCRADTTYVGVEIELEKVSFGSIPVGTWTVKEDNSLKEDGYEFVTIPIPFKYLEIELQRLFKGITNYSISSRCSTHIHINCRDMTATELKVFILLYLIFERSLYRISGDRWKNNFCVPCRSDLSTVRSFFSKISHTGIHNANWHKYFGFNISPIFGGESSRIGTIEFRHMEGTGDIKRIIQWINFIVSLKISAKKMSYKDIIGYLDIMNTDSSYIWLTETVFKKYKDIILNHPTFKRDIEGGISFAKNVALAPQKGVYSIPLIEKPKQKGRKICVV